MNLDATTVTGLASAITGQDRWEQEIGVIDELKAETLARIKYGREAWERLVSIARASDNSFAIDAANEAINKLDQKFQGQIRQYLSLVKAQESLDRKIAHLDVPEKDEPKTTACTTPQPVETRVMLQIPSEDKATANTPTQNLTTAKEPSIGAIPPHVPPTIKGVLRAMLNGAMPVPESVDIEEVKRKLAKYSVPGVTLPQGPKLNLSYHAVKQIAERRSGLQGSRGS